MRAVLTKLVNHFRLKKKLRRAQRKKDTFSLRVTAVGDFLADLEQAGICHCVLRWPAAVRLEAPPAGMSKAQVDQAYGDVDLLVEMGEAQLPALLRVAARHADSRGVRCDFYSTYGLRGFGYLRFPYYPPLWARRLLRERCLDARGFYRLAGTAYIESLVYHVLYHKAAALSMADPEGQESIAGYLHKVRVEAAREGVELPAVNDLEALRGWLQSRGCDMPYDLKVRWPLQGGWLKEVLAGEEQSLQAPIDGYGYFCVFVLRDDLESAQLLGEAEAQIRQRFEVRQVIQVPPELRVRLASKQRGGNWMEGREGAEILPCTFLLCNDPAPATEQGGNPDYPHLDNLNMLWKHELREIMTARAGMRVYGVHSSDNHQEAMSMLQALQECGLAS